MSPDVVVAVQLVLAHPRRQNVPLHRLAPIDRDAVLCVLVLGVLQVTEHLFSELCQEAAMQQVVLHAHSFSDQLVHDVGPLLVCYVDKPQHCIAHQHNRQLPKQLIVTTKRNFGHCTARDVTLTI